MVGQINLDSKLGQIIYDFVARENIKSIVEIGTWNGFGSTNCIRQSIFRNKKKDYNVISLEINQKMCDIASKYHTGIDNFHVILGSILIEEDLKWFDWDQYFNGPEGKHGTINKIDWFNEDLENIKNVPYVMDRIPDEIDLLILDGGEFSTYPEFKKLEERSKIIILDDTNEMKCRKIRSELLNNNIYKILYDESNDRNGFFVVEKK